jgi:hypothetical protein
MKVSEKLSPIYRGIETGRPYIYAVNHSTNERVIQDKVKIFNLKIEPAGRGK